MKTLKNIPILLIIGLGFLPSCDPKHSYSLNQKQFSPTSPHFNTLSEAPPDYRPVYRAGDEDRKDIYEDDEVATDEKRDLGPFPPPSGPAIPTFPPIPTDDDLFYPNPFDLFGDGPPVAPFQFCGNGILEPLEQCDDGNLDNFDGCNIICGLPFCGNGVLELNEECDDGNLIDGDGCSKRCLFERCGNERLDPGEQCDDGNMTENDGCSPCCLYEICGNFIVDPGEQCDDGNHKNHDGCDDCCRLEPKKQKDHDDDDDGDDTE